MKPLIAVAYVVAIYFGFFALIVHAEDGAASLPLVELHLVVAEEVAMLEALVADFACEVLDMFSYDVKRKELTAR